MQRYKIIVGDYSGDGHEQSDICIVEVNHLKDEILSAYNRARAASKVSLTSLSREEEKKGYVSVGAEYEQNRIFKSELNKLSFIGVNFDNLLLEDEEDDGSFCFWGEEGIIQLFMEMAKSQLPTLTYEIINDGLEVLMEGIGYGLYYN